MAFLLNRFFTKRRRIVEQIYKRTMASKTLVAFDFDHTLIDENSDIYMQQLAPNGVIPPEIKSMYSSKSWTHYMGSIFSYFHSNGIEKSDILTCMHEIQFTKGMPELLHYLSESDCYETIIISDSNSVFIDTILRHHKLKDTVTEIFTNPAEFDESGCLKIEFYHTQDWCELSTINMCKGAILEDYMEKRHKEGVKFDQVYYIGDGMNDLCPSLRLRDSDFACPRIDFTLWKKIEKSRTNNDAKQEGGPDNLGIKATLLPWNDGYNLLEVMQCAK